MVRGFFRRAITTVAALGVLTLAALPAEHLHAAEAADRHHEDVVHRHWDAHHSAGTEGPVAHDAGHGTLWIDSPFTHPEVVSHINPDAQGAPSELLVSRPQDAGRPTLPFVRLSVHDPPGIASNGLRGPPLLVA